MAGRRRRARHAILDPMSHENPSQKAPTTAEEWDERYGTANRWSGEPNQTLTTVVADLVPGTVLDVGCGEGADAVWLARHGWSVTALDLSRVAVERGRARADAAGLAITWLVQGFGEAETGKFDLVSVQYPAIPRGGDEHVEEALERAVPAALDALNLGGRFVAMSYHSLEDKIVKRALTAEATSKAPKGFPVELEEHKPTIKIITRGAEPPTEEEIAQNSRAASAKLRAAEKIRIPAQ